MSYEGYEQYLCAQGHYWIRDVYYSGDIACPHCKGDAVWYNAVDETNGSFSDTGERIDGYLDLQILTPPQPHTCDCGHTHATATTYELPSTDVGHHGIVPRHPLDQLQWESSITPELAATLYPDEEPTCDYCGDKGCYECPTPNDA